MTNGWSTEQALCDTQQSGALSTWPHTDEQRRESVDTENCIEIVAWLSGYQKFAIFVWMEPGMDQIIVNTHRGHTLNTPGSRLMSDAPIRDKWWCPHHITDCVILKFQNIPHQLRAGSVAISLCVAPAPGNILRWWVMAGAPEALWSLVTCHHHIRWHQGEPGQSGASLRPVTLTWAGTGFIDNIIFLFSKPLQPELW